MDVPPVLEVSDVAGKQNFACSVKVKTCGCDGSWQVNRYSVKLTYTQTCFTNSTEVLFGVLTFYQLRVIERLWGSRKFAVSLQRHVYTRISG